MNTTPTPTTTATTTTAGETDPATVDVSGGVEQVVRVAMTAVGAHPDNVRSCLGDLAGLTRSIKAHGVMLPLLVTPPGLDGMHQIIAGHRRHAAADAAGLDTVPVLIRDLTGVEVLDAMLIENGQRADLTPADTIRAVARYQHLAPGDSPTKIGRRIGRTAGWVKTRLALAVLPDDVLARLDGGELTMAAATAIATVADLGDDAVRAVTAELVERHGWGDPAERVARWRTRHLAVGQLDRLVESLTANAVTIYPGDSEARAARAVRLDGAGLGFDARAQRAHRREPCHGVVASVGYDDRVHVTSYCTTPKRHRGSDTAPDASPIRADTATETTGGTGRRDGSPADDGPKARRTARTARHTAAAGWLPGGRIAKQSTVIGFAARCLAGTVSYAAGRLALGWLGIAMAANSYDQAGALTGWLDGGGDPARLLIACHAAELETCGGVTAGLGRYPGGAARQWVELLAAYGSYTPDEHDLQPDNG